MLSLKYYDRQSSHPIQCFEHGRSKSHLRIRRNPSSRSLGRGDNYRQHVLSFRKFIAPKAHSESILSPGLIKSGTRIRGVVGRTASRGWANCRRVRMQVTSTRKSKRGVVDKLRTR
ncbi:hypothetical protein BaRGS_00001288 [Batillaria attramentaria]|uniref:Uncharacterized protein n=1 Tax=Batillaria attramentaria TaxID=370345 RepID=A0ABD0M6G5_9CAEN